MKRTCKVTFRLNRLEQQTLRRMVKKTGLSQEGYLRMLIAEHVPKELPPIEYHHLIRALSVISNSMNQIAARANATGFFLALEYAEQVVALRKQILSIQAAMTLPERIAPDGYDKDLERE